MTTTEAIASLPAPISRGAVKEYRGTSAVRAKGWTDDKEVDKIVRNAFELCAGNAYQMPVEWYLSMIVRPEEVTA